MKVLLAEDTRDLNRSVTVLFQMQGYEVDSAFDGEQALDFLKNDSYDCVVLDIMMPKVDGYGVLAEMRRRHISTPVLLLTAKAEIDDRVTGLDAGADDYLPKPFAVKELLARIRALTRRRNMDDFEELRVGDTVLNADNYTLSSANSVRLSNKEFDLMALLMSNTDIALSTDYLLDRVWKHDENAHEDTVWLYISYLKRKLQAINSSYTITGSKGESFQLAEVKGQ
ncbi:MAG: response regulator transcription factor [Clostridiales bacterium]|nr:response regulator transcription factor [Clostridiales bacterium]